MPISILMPALSPTMTEGNLSKWLVKEGDAVASGDALAEIETDKATMEVEAVDEGVLGKILVAEGTEGVPVNHPIALILEEGEDASALQGVPDGVQTAAPPVEETPAAAAPPPQPAPPPAPSAPAPTVPATAKGGRVIASPLARRLAARAGIDLARIKGSGPHGRIVKRDVEGAAAVTLPAAAVPVEADAPFTDVPHSTMRRIIAERLQEAKRTVPHFYLSIDCRIDALLDARRALNAASPEGDGAYKISVNDFIIRAVALALKQVPAANASWMEHAIRLYNRIDVSVAVATPGGLITPVIRNADGMGLGQISAEIRDLAGRARQGKLAPEEYRGGGFTISNLGMFGVSEFAAILNPPQSCILAVGAGEERPVVSDGALTTATVMTCTLSVDHRSVDGAVGAQFLAAFKRLIEEPVIMLL